MESSSQGSGTNDAEIGRRVERRYGKEDFTTSASHLQTTDLVRYSGSGQNGDSCSGVGATVAGKLEKEEEKPLFDPWNICNAGEDLCNSQNGMGEKVSTGKLEKEKEAHVKPRKLEHEGMDPHPGSGKLGKAYSGEKTRKLGHEGKESDPGNEVIDTDLQVSTGKPGKEERKPLSDPWNIRIAGEGCLSNSHNGGFGMGENLFPGKLEKEKEPHEKPRNLEHEGKEPHSGSGKLGIEGREPYSGEKTRKLGHEGKDPDCGNEVFNTGRKVYTGTVPHACMAAGPEVEVPKPPDAGEYLLLLTFPLDHQGQDDIGLYLRWKVNYEFQQLRVQGYKPFFAEPWDLTLMLHFLMESNQETVAEAMLRLFCIPHRILGRAAVDEVCIIVAKLFYCMYDSVYELNKEDLWQWHLKHSFLY